MYKKLSIVIPIYNFAQFITETLDTIVTQERFCEVEVVILDGASTDNTPVLVKKYQRFFNNINYIRLTERGGIDRDMARAVEYARGEFCWLFSGDDLMLPGALGKVLDQIESGLDLYLTRHMEWVDDRGEWVEWPTLNVSGEPIFQLSHEADRHSYFSVAENTEAFFGFIGGLIVKKSTWESVPFNEDFVGTCWAHVARLFEIMPQGLSVKVLKNVYLKRRPDNDSFGSGSITSRFRLTIDGFLKIVDHFFGMQSIEAQHVRRALRNEYHPLNMWLGKFLCLIDPEREHIALMDRLLVNLYGSMTWNDWRVRLNYARVTPERFRKWQPDLSAKFEAIKAAQASKSMN
jgi:abequosyltransferase